MRVELFPIVEKVDGLIVVRGAVYGEIAHRHSMRHLSVQIFPVALAENGQDCLVYLHRRSRFKRSGPGKLDVPGGHVEVKPEEFESLFRGGAPALERAFGEAAVAEANEEIKCDPPERFTRSRLVEFGTPGSFETESPRTDGTLNREYSSAYILGLAPSTKVSMWDSDREGERELEVVTLSADELVSRYESEPEDFADGIGRIFEAVLEKPEGRGDFIDRLFGVAAGVPK